MLEFFFALGLCAATLSALRGAVVSTGPFTIAGQQPEAVAIGFFAVAIAGYVLGPVYGLTLVMAVLLHEFGHFAAHRIAGHDDARFRYFPLIGGRQISETLPFSQERAFFIALMGAGMSVAPMATALVLAELTAKSLPVVSEIFWALGTTIAVLNIFNLLPFWPLDGGRCVRLLANTFCPNGTLLFTCAMSGAFIAAAIWMQSMTLLFLALLGGQGLFRGDSVEDAPNPMRPMRGMMAGAAYIFTFAAHFAGGATLIRLCL